MTRALELAERGRGRTSPNPLVGAVVVSPAGVVVGEGYHERAGEPHAEAHALDDAGERARGATLYCTLEPCCHTGRTGPCVERIVSSGISRLVASVEDPNPAVRGRGFAHLRAHGVEVTVGVGAERALHLNRPFFTFMRQGRPFVIMKVAVSRDGYVAAFPGARTSLTSGAARHHAHRVRAEVDAVGVGSTTLLVDDPLLTARGVVRDRPLTRVVFDRRLRTPPTARVLSTVAHGPVIIVTGARAAGSSPGRIRALQAAGALVEVVEPATLLAALRRLASRPILSIVLEGGPALHSAAWDAGLVDCVHRYESPVMLGSRGVPWLPGDVMSALVGRRSEPLGPDTFTEGYVHGTD
jgi:diaminohydroxyphosphoribosylaminopyrimidine deaminase/5-amino-6-(5-phosphoribosylamino)uracil reductase